MSDAELLSEVKGRVLVLTLNRPDKANALNASLMEALEAACQDAYRHDGVGVILLRGAGKGFSGGYDIATDTAGTAGPSTVGADAERIRATTDRWIRLWQGPKPTVAAVHGYCMAGGFELAMSCDLVLAAHDARLGFPAVRAQGVPPLMVYPWLMGMRRAKEFLWTGDEISGREAAALGLVNRSVAATDLEAEALRLAERVALMDPDLLTLSKRALHTAYEAMGYLDSVSSGVEFDALAHQTAAARRFREIVASDGLKAAIAWRDDPYRVRGGN